ncbi:MAG: transcriptional repressor [Bacteroidales bacterium]|nr:transcriptional repressor [Bacteroidales bacterium]
MVYEELLRLNNLKVTPQRVAVLEAFDHLKTHPTAEEISGYIRRKYPGIATGTIYKILDILVERGIIKKVKTDRDIMRYDSVRDNHHHLYDRYTDDITDYFDEDLDNLLTDYFRKKNIPGFRIDEIKLQISGKKTGKK